MQTVQSQSFARRFCALSVRSARRAQHLAIVLRHAGTDADSAQAELFRELARVNMREAKDRKRDAKQRGEW